MNRLVFPMVYGEGSKDDKLAEYLFNLAIKYAKDKDECILKKDKDRNIVV